MKTRTMNYAVNLWQRYVVCALALLVFALSPAYASQVTSGVSFAQVSFTDASAPQKYSNYGQVSVDYTMLYGAGYINVERYENGEPAGWVVKNLPVISGSVLSGFSTMFDLGRSGYQSSLTAYVSFTPDKLADDGSLKNQAPLSYRLAQAEYPVLAPRGTVKLNPQSGPVGTMVTVTVSGFPLNTDIVITFNGKKVATIPKGMDMGTFIVPQSSPPFSYEVRAAGGDPLTFGYAWFRVTKM